MTKKIPTGKFSLISLFWPLIFAEISFSKVINAIFGYTNWQKVIIETIWITSGKKLVKNWSFFDKKWVIFKYEVT